MGVAGAVAGTFGIQPLVGAFGVPYQAAEPRDERLIRVPLRIRSEMSQGGVSGSECNFHPCSGDPIYEIFHYIRVFYMINVCRLTHLC